MQGDLYATKGIEYLVVIGYLLAMAVAVGAIALLRSRRARAARAAERSRAAVESMEVLPAFALTDGYAFHTGHGWVGGHDGGTVTVGLDGFAATALGEPDALELPAVGSAVRQGGPGWTVRVGDRALPMRSPVEGEVVAVNPAVLASPRLAAADPYGAGWLLKVRAANGVAWPRNLFSGGLAAAWMQYTVEQLGRLRGDGLGVVMADGGTPVRGFAKELDPEAWAAITRELFLAD